MFTELVFFYLLFVYKVNFSFPFIFNQLKLNQMPSFQPFGATFIQNDLLLSTIGACAAISNTLFRLFMGYIKDMFSYKVVQEKPQFCLSDE